VLPVHGEVGLGVGAVGDCDVVGENVGKFMGMGSAGAAVPKQWQQLSLATEPDSPMIGSPVFAS